MTPHWDCEAYEDEYLEAERLNNRPTCRRCEENPIEEDRLAIGSNICQSCRDEAREEKLRFEYRDVPVWSDV